MSDRESPTAGGLWGFHGNERISVMTTIADLLREQQATDDLITRAYRAELGFVFKVTGQMTTAQTTLLYRMQQNSNLRLEALVERMERANASKEKDAQKDTPEAEGTQDVWSSEQDPPNRNA